MELAKLRSELSLALQQTTVYLREAWNALTRSQSTVADRLRLLQEPFRTTADDVGRVLERSVRPIVVTSGKFTKQIHIAWDQLAMFLRQGQCTLTGLGTRLFNKSQRVGVALYARANDLQNLLATSRDAIVVTNDNIIKQLSIALEQLTRPSRRVLNTFIGLGRTAVNQPGKVQEAIRTRMSDLQSLLATSLDAIVVMNSDRRIVAANSRALQLFGVSEANIREFAIDAFLQPFEIPYFHANSSPFIGRREKHGKCKIRGLAGGMRVAEYVFVANFVPFRHLCRFRNDRECTRKGAGHLRNS